MRDKDYRPDVRQTDERADDGLAPIADGEQAPSGKYEREPPRPEKTPANLAGRGRARVYRCVTAPGTTGHV